MKEREKISISFIFGDIFGYSSGYYIFIEDNAVGKGKWLFLLDKGGFLVIIF